MLKKISFIAIMLIFAASTSFAYDTKTSCDINKGSSAFFVEEHESNYVTLVEIIPGTGKMHVHFFDTQGNEVEIKGIKEITGRALLSDGTSRDVTFRSDQVLNSDFPLVLSSSSFEAEEAWLRYTNEFSLIMDVPVGNDAFELAYNYGC